MHCTRLTAAHRAAYFRLLAFRSALHKIIRKPGYPDIRKSEYPETRIFRYLEIRIFGNPDIQISGNPNIRKPGYPDIRKSEYPETRISRYAEIRIYPETRIRSQNLERSPNMYWVASGNALKLRTFPEHVLGSFGERSQT